MKGRNLFFSFIAVLFLISCKTTIVAIPKVNPNGKVPPGQMKKATGAKSAKSYAPGQQKKTSTTSSGNSKSSHQKIK